MLDRVKSLCVERYVDDSCSFAGSVASVGEVLSKGGEKNSDQALGFGEKKSSLLEGKGKAFIFICVSLSKFMTI